MTSETVISNRYTHTAVIALLAAFMFIISACGEGGAPPTGGSDAAAATPAADADEVLVEIDFDEYVVLMDAVVPAGPVTLKLANKGFEEHNLLFIVVQSDSTVWETESRLSPGERRTVMLDLEPGMYKAVAIFLGMKTEACSRNSWSRKRLRTTAGPSVRSLSAVHPTKRTSHFEQGLDHPLVTIDVRYCGDT